MSPIAGRALLALLCLTSAASAQSRGSSPPRIGVGFDTVTALWSQDVVPSWPSLGVRGRVALPVNADISVAASLGIGAHVFGGSDDTSYVLNPQTSLIVTLPSEGRARYVLGGFGGFLPFSDGGGGASIHAGAGLAFPLSEASLFVEANPSLIIGQDAVVPVLAARAGVIF